MKNKIYIGIAVIAGIILIFAIRTVIFSFMDFNKGEELLKERKIIEATVSFKHALRNYVPLFSKSEDATSELLKIAKNAEDNGDSELALRTLRMLRGGILSIRGLYQPFSDILSTTNEKIAFLMSKNHESKRKEYLVQLNENNDPSTLFSLLSSLCFIFWIGITILGIIKSITKEGKIIKKSFLIYGSTSVTFLLFWLFFLWMS